MKINRLLFTLLSASVFVTGITGTTFAQNKPVKEGNWRGVFKVGELDVPFNFEVKKKTGDELVLTAINGDRRDDFNAKYITPDSLLVTLNTFEAGLFAKIENDGSLTGAHKSLVPGAGRVIPFTANAGQSYRFVEPGKEIKPAANITGKWLIKIKLEVYI